MSDTQARDPLAFDFGLSFRSVSDRAAGERPARLALAQRALPFNHAFLDDYMRCVMPHDLILIGARTGAGKTELARNIAASNAVAGRTVHYFALEAEPDEIERRTKFTVLADLVRRDGRRVPGGFNYPDWYCGRLESSVGELDQEADEIMFDRFRSLLTYYRGRDFTQAHIARDLPAIQDATDLVVIDHLHYVDIPDENENRGLKDLVKTIRDVALSIGKPVVLVVHMRKEDRAARTLTPAMDDVHGSSDIAKIATGAVMLSPASHTQLGGYTVPRGHAATLIGVPKHRVGGACPYVALCLFDWRSRAYGDSYTLGRTGKNGCFEPIDSSDRPAWAHRHTPITALLHQGGEACPEP